MGLKHLEILGFRVFKHTTIEVPTEGITVFVGPNGTGKTSILEAAGLLGLGRSFRGASKETMIRNGDDTAVVRGQFIHPERDVLIETSFSRAGRSRTQINRQASRARSELAEAAPISTFCPGDLDVIQRSPSGRRDMLDDALALLEPQLGASLDEYQRALKQRNALLKQLSGRLSPEAESTLDIWDQRLGQAGDEIVRARRDLLLRLSPEINHSYRALSGETKETVIETDYESSTTTSLREALSEVRRDDLRRATTSLGPHRDDIVFLLNGGDARTQASQGEQRTLALSLRLAIHVAAGKTLGIVPTLLLDDVFSELDPERSRRLLTELPQGQALLSTASPLPPDIKPSLVVDVAALLA